MFALCRSPGVSELHSSGCSFLSERWNHSRCFLLHRRVCLSPPEELQTSAQSSPPDPDRARRWKPEWAGWGGVWSFLCFVTWSRVQMWPLTWQVLTLLCSSVRLLGVWAESIQRFWSVIQLLICCSRASCSVLLLSSSSTSWIWTPPQNNNSRSDLLLLNVEDFSIWKLRWRQIRTWELRVSCRLSHWWVTRPCSSANWVCS